MPSFLRYCHCVMLALLAPVHDSVTCRWVVAADSPVGFAGTGIGVADASAEAVPAPVAFRARIRNVYAVLFVRLPTVWLVVVDPLPDIACQLP